MMNDHFLSLALEKQKIKLESGKDAPIFHVLHGRGASAGAFEKLWTDKMLEHYMIELVESESRACVVFVLNKIRMMLLLSISTKVQTPSLLLTLNDE